MAEGDSLGSFPSDLRPFLDAGETGFFPDFQSLENAQFDQFGKERQISFTGSYGFQKFVIV